MLAACSAHFSKLFSNSTLNGQLIVILEGTHHQDLQILLQFMYKGVAYLHQDRIESVLRTAEVLQVNRPCQTQFIIPPPSPDNSTFRQQNWNLSQDSKDEHYFAFAQKTKFN